MTSRERFIAVLERRRTDRLPVTTHHVMPSFLKNHMHGISNQEFFEYFGLDPINWVMAYDFSPESGEYFDPNHKEMGFLEARRVVSDTWRVKVEPVDGFKLPTQRFNIITPARTLSMLLQADEHTTWVKEYLVKEKSDIDILARFMTYPKCNVEEINKTSDDYGNRGLIRGHISTFEGFGQPGCWQDAACLFGIQNLIMATFEDREWVHSFLKILQQRKKVYIDSLKGAKYDLIELGGGDASTTVISPDIFNEFVAPYDSLLIEHAHQVGQRIVYHTCGGMMPILEDIVAMKPDAMETFTPLGMGGDADLAEAKRSIGDRVCMIGGFDQFHFFNGCTEDDTRREVRRCFKAAGKNGG
ncbi:MAG TPA: uroporphyrinogen decarboxylase family protein, partial [Cyclobacteriaceae bacterium]|nr:uroporphyrinogen decarboxylase family protein [Cyclobacteriaceae bacterium]